MKDLLTSRKFWIAVITLAAVLFGQFVPAFKGFDAENAAGLLVIAITLIVGVAIDPGANAGTWAGLFKSRKFWGAAIGFVALMLDGFGLALPLASDQIVALVVAVAGWIIGVAIQQPVPDLPE